MGGDHKRAACRALDDQRIPNDIFRVLRSGRRGRICPAPRPPIASMVGEKAGVGDRLRDVIVEASGGGEVQMIGASIVRVHD